MMNYEDRIRAAYPSFSKSFARLADYLLDSYLEAAFMTATELGHAINVDATTVVRFSQQLGYSGYPELLREIRDKIKSQLLAQPQKTDNEDSIAGVVETTMEELDSIFAQTRTLLDPKVVEDLVQEIDRARKIILVPDHHANEASRTLQSALERGGFLVVVADTGLYELARLVRLATKDDLYIGFQTLAESDQVAAALQEARRNGAVTAAILGGASFSSAQSAAIKLFAYAQPSNVLTAMILNAIAYTIGESIRWQFSDRYTGSDKSIRLLADRIKKHGD